MHKNYLIGCAFAGLMMCIYAPVSGQMTAAVLDLEAKEGVNQGTANLLSDSLRTRLFEGQHFTIVSRENMQDILKEQKFQATGCTARECVVELGQLLGVKKMFAGSIGRLGQTYIINLKMLDVETGKIDNSVEETCPKCEEDSLLQSIEQAAYRVASARSGPESVKPVFPDSKPVEPKKESDNMNQHGLEFGIGGGNFSSINYFLGYRSEGFAVGIESGYYKIPTEISSLTPYIRMGKTLYFTIAGGQYSVYRLSKYGVNTGLGVNIPLFHTTGLMLDGRYHYISGTGSSVSYINVSTRLNFLFK